MIIGVIGSVYYLIRISAEQASVGLTRRIQRRDDDVRNISLRAFLEKATDPSLEAEVTSLVHSIIANAKATGFSHHPYTDAEKVFLERLRCTLNQAIAESGNTFYERYSGDIFYITLDHLMTEPMLVRLVMAKEGKIPMNEARSGLCSPLFRNGMTRIRGSPPDYVNDVAVRYRPFVKWIDGQLQSHGVEPLMGFYLSDCKLGLAHYLRPQVLDMYPPLRPLSELTDPNEIIVYAWPSSLAPETGAERSRPIPL